MSRFTLEQLNPAMRRQAEQQLGMVPRAAVRTVRVKDEPEPPPATRKYRNQIVEHQGEKFDSKKELRCWLRLKDREARGEIRNLRRQVKFSLFDAGGHCRGEHIGTFRADYVWNESSDGRLCVGDCKSEKTRTLRDWPRTKALMRACHGIEVIEF